MNPVAVPASPWLTVKQAAERVSISESLLKREIAANRAPHRHIGRRVVVHRDELDRWILGKPGVVA